MLRTLYLLVTLGLLGMGSTLAQEAAKPKPAGPIPGEVPAALLALYPQLEQRKLYAGSIQYTAETVKALTEAAVPRDKWLEKRTAFFLALTENLAFRGFVSPAGDRELKPASCDWEFILITVPGGVFDAKETGALAAKHGLKLLVFEESAANVGMRTINPGFGEEAIRTFWVAGREVKWTLNPAPETYTYRVNGVEKTGKRQWKGSCTTTCSEVTDAGFKLGSRYSLSSTNSGRSGGGGARVYNMAAMLLTQVPLKGQFASLPLLQCDSKCEQETLKIDEKEYACTRFTTRPRYLDASESNYDYAEFYFCAEVPGVPLMVESYAVRGEETQTSQQIFDTTAAPK